VAAIGVGRELEVTANACRTPRAGADAPTFEVLTIASAHQQRAVAQIQAMQM
jgi:hypothetical protein